MDEDSIEKALKKSGLNPILGIMAAFRGAQGARYPGTIKGTLYTAYEVFSELIVIINLVTIFAKMVAPGEQMISRCLCGFPFISCILCSFMSLYPKFTEARFKKLLWSYETHFQKTLNQEHLAEELEKGAKTVRMNTKVLLILEWFPMTLFTLVLPSINEVTGQALGPRKMHIPAHYPFDVLSSFQRYTVIIFIQGWGSIFVNMKRISFEETLYIFATRQIALLKHLCHNLNTLFSPLIVNKDGTIKYESFRDRASLDRYLKKQLVQWIKNHQQCLRQLNDLQGLYSTPLVIYFGLTILILCTAVFVVSDDTVELQTIVLCAAFTFGNVVELLFICRMGELITVETNKLSQAIIGTNAFLVDADEYRYLRMIMTRLRKGSEVKAWGVFPLSINTFTNIATSSYSYYTMLKKVK